MKLLYAYAIQRLAVDNSLGRACEPPGQALFCEIDLGFSIEALRYDVGKYHRSKALLGRRGNRRAPLFAPVYEKGRIARLGAARAPANLDAAAAVG